MEGVLDGWALGWLYPCSRSMWGWAGGWRWSRAARRPGGPAGCGAVVVDDAAFCRDPAERTAPPAAEGARRGAHGRPTRDRRGQGGRQPQNKSGRN